MAAPRRRPIAKTVEAPPAATIQTPMVGSLRTTEMSASKPLFVVQPSTTAKPEDMFLMKVSQLVMMGIGFLAIWGGIFSVAFDENATNDNFLVLFIGGLASFGVAIGVIELQSKKNDYHLYDVQNYFLGIAFFFSTVGVLWGTRYLMGVATGSLQLDWFGNPAHYTTTDWSPNANGVYAQTLTCLLLTFAHYKLLKRYTGDTSFGWGVATYAPMAILLAGVGPWIRWSDHVVSWELGVAIISVTLVSMEMSLRSNKALNFVIIAFAAGLVPILYETLNSNAPVDGSGGALSLMVFIIGLQGYYAARHDLRKDVMERASLLLIGQVVVAIAISRANPDYNLILGPFRAGNFAILADYLNISVALWCIVLFAYFPAVLQQRVPWMPIGLALALFVIPMDASTIPWALSMLVLPYMVFISKVARKWVVNLTMLAFSGSYLLTDWYGYANDVSAQSSFGGGWLHVVIPLFLLGMAELGRRQSKLDTSITLAMIGAVILSRAILDPEWYLPWLLVGYMIFVTWSTLSSFTSPTLSERKDATLSSAFTGITVLILALLDKLSLPPTDAFDGVLEIGFRPQFMLLSILLYFLSRKSKTHEFDFGSILKWLDSPGKEQAKFDISTGNWVLKVREEESELKIINGAWSTLARPSILASLVLFTLSLSTINYSVWDSNPYLVLLLLFPVAALVVEILTMDFISSGTRATGVGLLVFIAAPLSVKIGTFEGTHMAAILMDAILVLAPLGVNAVINKRGVDHEGLNRTGDAIAYLLLLVLASLDVSGGLLMVPLAVLVAVQTLKYNFNGIGLVIPLIFLTPSSSWFDDGVLGGVLNALPEMFANYFLNYHSGPFIAFFGIFVCAHMSLNLFNLHKQQERPESATFIAIISVIWLSVGLLSCLPDGYWIPTFATFTLMFYLRSVDKSEALPYTIGLLFISLIIGFTSSNSFAELSDAEAIGWSGFICGVTGTILGLMHQFGKLFLNATLDDTELRSQDSTAGLALQIGSLGFIVSFDIFHGIGPILGFIMLTWSALKKGQENSLLLLPILLTFSIYNLMIQSEIGDGDQRTIIAGTALAIQGILLSVLSTKDDIVYDWEAFHWESDEKFFAYMDLLGIAGVTYSIIGVYMGLNPVELTSVAYILMTVYLIVIGVQGFSPENDSRWRRGLGGYGSILTSLLFANSLTSGLFGALGFVLMGMVALGFGFLFMQRMNEDNSIYVGTDMPARTEDGLKNDDSEALSSSVNEDVEDETASLDDAVADEEKPSQKDAKVEKTTPKQPKDDVEKQTTTSSKTTNEQAPTQDTASAKLEKSGLLMTDKGFAVRLPADAVDNIIKTLSVTPHEGYDPVVAFGAGGQIMLTFEESKASQT